MLSKKEHLPSVNKAHDVLRNKIVKAINLRTISKFKSIQGEETLELEEADELGKMYKSMP